MRRVIFLSREEFEALDETDPDTMYVIDAIDDDEPLVEDDPWLAEHLEDGRW